MYSIHKNAIPEKLAQKSITEYKTQLKRELQNTSLTAKQRKALKQRLRTVLSELHEREGTRRGNQKLE